MYEYWKKHNPKYFNWEFPMITSIWKSYEEKLRKWFIWHRVFDNVSAVWQEVIKTKHVYKFEYIILITSSTSNEIWPPRIHAVFTNTTLVALLVLLTSHIPSYVHYWRGGTWRDNKLLHQDLWYLQTTVVASRNVNHRRENKTRYLSKTVQLILRDSAMKRQ